MTNKSLLKGTTTLVWNRGDPRNLDSVWLGIKEANLDRDIGKRWYTFWAAHIRKEIPPDIVREISSGGGVKEKSNKDKLLLTHDMDSDGSPIYVGEGQGALTHDEAFELGKIRASAKARGGQDKGETPGDSLAVKAVEKVSGDMKREPICQVDDTEKIIAQFKAIKELLGDGKSESGNSMDSVINVIKAVREMFPENKAPINPSQPSTQYLIDKQTGQMQQIQPGTPIIIQTAPQNPYIPIQMDPDGKPAVPSSLDTWLILENFKNEQRRKEESHDVKMDIGKGLKEVVKNLGGALSEMGGRKD